MDTAIFIGLANQKALRREMDVVAHNVANMNTTAFKKESVVFRQFLVDAENAPATVGGKVSYMLDYGVVRNLDQGEYIKTGNPLDVFIDGAGYIAVEGTDGTQVYTRNGRMEIDAEGFLTTYSGERILDDRGSPIELPDGATNIGISENGTISSDEGEIATLGLYTFEQEQDLKRRGNSLYETIQDPIPADDEPVKVRQFAIEGSNVNNLQTLVDMTRILRTYQSVAGNQDELQKMREDSLGRLSRVQ